MHRLCGVLLLAVVGCGSASTAPRLYPVTGTLKVGGKPMEMVSVQLIPAEADPKARPAIGVTNKEGHFKLLTNGDKGVTAGKFKVVLTSVDGAGEVPDGPVTVEEATKMSGMYAKTKGPPKVKPPFPKEWTNAKTSPKTVEIVDRGIEEMPIDIDDK